MSAFVDMEIKGGDELLKQLNVLANSSQAVSRAAIGAGCSVLANACRAASPGSVKDECGWFLRTEGDRVWGRAGLMRFPRPGDGPDGPHGAFLTLGTKYILARRFIETALKSSRQQAIAAAKRAAERKVAKLANQS